MNWPGMGDPYKRNKTIKFLLITAAIAITIGAGSLLTMRRSQINSGNANPVGGMGTLNYQAVTLPITGSIAPATALHKAYCRYADEHNLPRLKQRTFGQVLTSLGYQRNRKAPKGAFAYLDLELKQTA